MNLRPLGGHVIVESASKEAVTASGIIIPDTAEKDRPERGIVIAVGAGKILENGHRAAIDVKVGDQVVFKKYSPDEIKLENKTYLIVSADDIMAIIE